MSLLTLPPTQAPPRTTLLGPIVALGAAALIFAAVAANRWWPCALSGVESTVCSARQDDSYDAAHPAEYYVLALAYLLAAAGIALVGRATADRGAKRLAYGAAALPGLTALMFARAPLPGPVATFAFFALTFAAGPLAALAAGRLTGGRVRSWAIAFGLGVFFTSMIVDSFIVAPIIAGGYTSWDANPYTWVGTALGCAVAAVALARIPSARAQPTNT